MQNANPKRENYRFIKWKTILLYERLCRVCQCRTIRYILIAPSIFFLPQGIKAFFVVRGLDYWPSEISIHYERGICRSRQTVQMFWQRRQRWCT